jgi:D-alanyl-D-alanine carboxypeptidase
VKTGYTNPAQHTLATAALWGTREMVCVVMHSTKLGKWDDSKMLLTYGFSNAPEDAGAGPRPATTASR